MFTDIASVVLVYMLYVQTNSICVFFTVSNKNDTSKTDTSKTDTGKTGTGKNGTRAKVGNNMSHFQY